MSWKGWNEYLLLRTCGFSTHFSRGFKGLPAHLLSACHIYTLSLCVPPSQGHSAAFVAALERRRSGSLYGRSSAQLEVETREERIRQKQRNTSCLAKSSPAGKEGDKRRRRLCFRAAIPALAGTCEGKRRPTAAGMLRALVLGH